MSFTHKEGTSHNHHKPIRYIYDIEKIRQIPQNEIQSFKEITSKYPLKVNSYYLNLINWNDPNDPIKRLVIPHKDELLDWGSIDCSNEKSNTVRNGVQHKYNSTVLFLVSETCASLCRYCFRKRLFLKGNKETNRNVEEGIKYIQDHPEVDNVFLTGGDTLMLSTRRLEYIIQQIRRIEHVKIIRIGTKMPAFNPYRILNDDALIKMFKKYSEPSRRIYMMCHFDHPNELTPQSKEAMRRVIDAGVICLNQNPIIRGVSDNPAVMKKLWQELTYMGVAQYYVFQNRPTLGNAPYSVPIVKAYTNIEKAKDECSGLAKRVKYVMSHTSGKVEVAGVDSRYIYLKYHRAGNAVDNHRFLICHRDNRAIWLDQLKPVKGFENKYYSDIIDSFRIN